MITQLQALDYEIRASWWACRADWPWLQRLAGWHFARKVRRKWGRYRASLDERDRVSKR